MVFFIRIKCFLSECKFQLECFEQRLTIRQFITVLIYCCKTIKFASNTIVEVVILIFEYFITRSSSSDNFLF